jgi:hypothetical protein
VTVDRLPAVLPPLLIIVVPFEAEPYVVDVGLDGAGAVDRLLQWIVSDPARAALLEAALAATTAQGWK